MRERRRGLRARRARARRIGVGLTWRAGVCGERRRRISLRYNVTTRMDRFVPCATGLNQTGNQSRKSFRLGCVCSPTTRGRAEASVKGDEKFGGASEKCFEGEYGSRTYLMPEDGGGAFMAAS